MTKREIATSILNSLGEESNHELLERIKDRVIALRAKLLRQSIAKYGIDEMLLQTYEIKMVRKVDDNNCYYFESECMIPVTLRNVNSTSPFQSVTTTHSKPYTWIRHYERFTIPKIRINQLTKYYSLLNSKIQVFNSNVKVLTVTDVFEGLNEFDLACKGVCVSDDMYLPMPADIATDIIKLLITEFKQLQQETIIEVKE